MRGGFQFVDTEISLAVPIRIPPKMWKSIMLSKSSGSSRPIPEVAPGTKCWTKTRGGGGEQLFRSMDSDLTPLHQHSELLRPESQSGPSLFFHAII